MIIEDWKVHAYGSAYSGARVGGLGFSANNIPYLLFSYDPSPRSSQLMAAMLPRDSPHWAAWRLREGRFAFDWRAVDLTVPRHDPHVLALDHSGSRRLLRCFPMFDTEVETAVAEVSQFAGS